MKEIKKHKERMSVDVDITLLSNNNVVARVYSNYMIDVTEFDAGYDTDWGFRSIPDWEFNKQELMEMVFDNVILFMKNKSRRDILKTIMKDIIIDSIQHNVEWVENNTLMIYEEIDIQDYFNAEE